MSNKFPPSFSTIMECLKKAGTAQTAKIHQRHESGPNVYGVSLAELKKLKKKIGINHSLALTLWASQNVDAQSLAIMTADPKKTSTALAQTWVEAIRYYLISDLLAGLISKTPEAISTMKTWMDSDKEFVQATGYTILSHLLKDGLLEDTAFCKALLETIPSKIHQAPNRGRHAMNQALIAIGVYVTSLSQQALDVADNIGTVQVDHGQTSCKTPPARPYIEKTLARQKGN